MGIRALSPAIAAGVSGARTAPSAHNSQPWRFGRDEVGIWLGWNPGRELPHGDPKKRYLVTSLGAAMEGFRLGVAGVGGTASAEFTLDRKTARVARLTVGGSAPDADDVRLADALPYRQTTRWPYQRQAVPVAALRQVTDVAEMGDCHVAFVTTRPKIRGVAKLIAAGASHNFADHNVFEEFHSLLRFDRKNPAYERDGLTADTLASRRAAAWGLRAGLHPATMRVLVATRLHRVAAATQAALVRRTPVVGLLSAPSHDPQSLFAAGRVMLRMWLTATSLGLKVHPMTAAFDNEGTRGPLAEAFGLSAEASLVLCFRLGHSSPAPRSPRLPVNEFVSDWLTSDAF